MATSDTITQYYTNVLQRAPSASELSSWVALVDSNAVTLAQALDAIVNSTEAQTYTAQVIRFYQAAFGRVPDTTGIDGWVDDLVAGTTTTTQLALGFVNSTEWSNRYGGTEVNQATLTGLYQNVLGRTPSGAEVDAWIATGQSMDQVFIGFANSAEFQANAASAVNTLMTTAGNTTTATVATVYDGTSALGVTTNVGSTFTLTTAVDTITGTDANDTVIGLVDGTTAANSTLTAADTIAAGGGTADVLNITTQGAGAVADAINGAAVTGIETINLRATGTGGVALAATNAPGVTLINNNLSTDAVTVTAVADSTSLKVTGNGVATNGATTATYAAAATSGDLEIADGVTAGAIAVNGAGLTSLAITSTGAANTTGAISTTGTPTSVSIAASTNLTTTGLAVGTNAAAQALTITGIGAVSLGTLDADFATIDASGNSGGLTATMSATATAAVTGSSAADKITTGVALTTGSVDAGAGTDTLIQANTAHINSTTLGAKYTNFEILQANNGVTVDMDNYTGSTITAVNVLDAAGGVTVTDMTATQGGAVTILGAGGGTIALDITGDETVGQLDTLTILVSDGDTTTSENIGAFALTTTSDETLAFTATDDLTISSMAASTGITSLTVAGAGNASITTGAMAVTTNLAVDFSALTGANTFNFAAATANAVGFTGGSGVDTVTDSAIGGNVITAGAGNDIINLTDKTAGAGTTVVTGGAGADTVNVSMIGNTAIDAMKFIFAAGDSVSDTSTTGISATLTDTVAGLDGATLAAAAGSQAEFDTEVAATAVTTGGAVTLGTTTVTNAGDFYVNIVNATTAYIYQDTDGDKVIESGEFAVALTGVGTDTLLAADFTISGGDLILATT